MKFRSRRKGLTHLRTGLSRRAWPIHGLLVVAVLTTICFAIWSTSETVNNERLAVRQRLLFAYESQLHSLRRTFEASWQERLRKIDTLVSSLPAQEAFAKAVEANLAESIIVHRDAEGISYPNLRSGQSQSSPVRAAALLQFHSLAEEIKSDLAEGERKSAFTSLLNLSRDQKSLALVDREGRHPVLNLLCFAVESEGDPANPIVSRITENLALVLNNYASPDLLSAQRLFLMRRLVRFIPDRDAFPTMEAEELATRSNEAGLARNANTSLVRSSLDDVWQITYAGDRVTALFSSGFLQRKFQEFTSEHISLNDIEVDWIKPGESLDSQSFVSVTVGKFLPDWRLVLNLRDDRLLTSALEQRVALYTVLGAVMIAVSILLGLGIAGLIQRRLNLTRLKDNLVATVSHELKTPVASVRVLVDTLLDRSDLDEKQTREYLELISRENMRLSNLVDNFLAFSRMERGKHRFVFEPTDARIIAQDSARAFCDRFELQPDEFILEISDNLPEIMADADSLKIAVINLLENAFKYSEHPHRIQLTVASDDDSLVFTVQDNGIGIHSREKRRIFDRFYRTDQKLARSEGGVGLGLSIVQFIVSEHRGQVSVESEADVGSTFSIVLPWKRLSLA